MHSFVVNKDNKINDINTNTAKTPQKIYDIQSSMIKIEDLAVNSALRMENSTAIMDISNKSSEFDDVEMFLAVDTQPNEVDEKIKATKLSEVNSWVLVTPTVIVRKRDVKDVASDKEDLIDLPLEEEPDNGTVLFKREIIKPEQQPPVQVHIQNITEVSE